MATGQNKSGKPEGDSLQTDSGGGGGNPGKAGPKGALEEGIRGEDAGARSGDPYSVGRNVRRDYVRLPKKKTAKR